MERKNKTKAQPNISETVMPDINVNMSQINGNMPNGDGQYRNVPDGDTVVIDTKPDIIGVDEIHEALRILNRYKSDRSVTDSRIINNQKWWRLRNWDSNKNKSNSTFLFGMLSGIPFLFSCIYNACNSINIYCYSGLCNKLSKLFISVFICFELQGINNYIFFY